MEIPATLGAADVQMSSLAILLTITVNVTTMHRLRYSCSKKIEDLEKSKLTHDLEK